MKLKNLIPSFRIQIVLLFFILLMLSILFMRTFFIRSYQNYLRRIPIEKLDGQLSNLYSQYKDKLSTEEDEKYKRQIENMLIEIKQIEIAKGLYQHEIIIYSVYMFVFVSLSVLIIFLVSVNLITKPLKRLQNATGELTEGNLQIQLKENRFSPINNLIVSFNQMVSELEENRKQIIEAEKKLIWREIARVMAHEIKNPLTPIRLSIERLEQKYLENSENIDTIFCDTIKIVKEEINNLQMLVRRFSDFAKMPEPNPGYYDLSEQLNEILNLYKNQHNIHQEIKKDLPDFYGDKMQMRQVFINLTQNALQAIDKNGKLTIGAKFENLNFIIAFTDNGSGIDKIDIEKIFEPYFTTKRKGTGLGLAVVKRIIENHSGTIKVKSEKGKGTEFTIFVPLKKNDGTIPDRYDLSE